MPSFKAMVLFTLTTAAIIIAGESFFQYEDPRIVSPLVQSVAFAAGFLVEWPVWVRHQPGRRAKTFAVYAGAIVAAMALIAAFRIAIGLAYIERAAVRFVSLAP
jgi:hypothetical protein